MDNPLPDARPAHAAKPFSFSPEVQEILSLVGDGVVSVDQQGRIILFNKAAETVFGYTAEEMFGHPLDILIPPRFQHQHRADLAGFCAPGTPLRRTMGAGREVLGRHKDGHELAIEATLSRQMFDGQPIFTAVVRDVTTRKQAEQQHRLVAGEVAHRLRNTMAVINSIVSLTARGAATVADYKNALLGRFTAISRTNDLLIDGTSTEADLRALLLAELAPFRQDDDRIALTGPAVSLGDEAIIALALIIHELGTNAAKYGSLSISQGTIRIDWEVSAGAPVFHLVWKELGGPAVIAPTRRGFGSGLISHSLQRFGGKAELTYPASGLCCVLSLPLTAQSTPAGTMAN